MNEIANFSDVKRLLVLLLVLASCHKSRDACRQEILPVGNRWCLMVGGGSSEMAWQGPWCN